ncbi:translation initiation factor IF-2 N-terminal domain-containing protein [Candidatus Kuenenbacteria bacterium]|nr:translation initiation factor IF-2 N-terminal domain-containing protein [Candidatus Kuenenbacteria bacterium]
MNITELARKLKISTVKLREELPKLGFDIGQKAIKVNPWVANKIMENFQKGLIKFEEEKKEEKIIHQLADKKEIKIPATITVYQLAQKLEMPVVQIISELIKNGIMATINEEIDFETASIVAQDLGFKTQIADEVLIQDENIITNEKLKEILKEDEDKLESKPPVVVIMGHVDHGKTTLLDFIRKTNVASSESHGITQHIGAYQIKIKSLSRVKTCPESVEGSRDQKHTLSKSEGAKTKNKEKENEEFQKITFLDTPGHEAFKAMRARGGRVADIAILVVAADDGLKPQTFEAIKIIQQEKLPFIVAINKIDKPGVDIERLKQQLAENNLLPEDWGGKIICIPISAKKGDGVDYLLEMILLIQEMEKIKANPNREALGTIIESHLDSQEGAVATVLIQTGILKKGDAIIIGPVSGRARTLKSFDNLELNEAKPGTPVKILGLKKVCQVGDILEAVSNRKEFKKKEKENSLFFEKKRKKILFFLGQKKILDAKELNIILKFDVSGSEEAILESLVKIHRPELIINVVAQGLGNIAEADVMRAHAGQAQIFGLHVQATKTALILAREKNVQIKIYETIYDLIDEINKIQKELAKTTKIERIDLGHLRILATFKKGESSIILGGQVLDGKIIKKEKVDIKRRDKKIGEGIIDELQTNKVPIEEVSAGAECGIKLNTRTIVMPDDVLYVYEEKITETE